MPNVTMAFDEGVQGWTSEFSFVPDSGLSLNNKFYTFSDGRMWQHNDDTLPRNNFYGVQNDTIVEFVFNQNPTIVKNFKTLGYEGEGSWPAEIETNLEDGQITQYIVKEGERYSWIQGDDANQFSDVDYASNAVAGVGNVSSIGAGGELVFSSIPEFIDPGDALWLLEGGTTTPVFVGVIDVIDRDALTISYNQEGVPGINGPTQQDPVSGDFILHVKNNRQEKSGVVGYYSKVTMTNSDIERAEIFSVNSNSFTQTRS